jgi:hypothetical protein
MQLSDAGIRAVKGIASWCPAPGCCQYVSGLGGANIYRSSRRSVTMRCPDCGLTWTVTAHQMAKAARRLLETRNGELELDETDVLVLERWAREVSDGRGRRRTA